MGIIQNFYDKVILSYPRTILILFFIFIGLLGYQAQKLEIDASAETLLVEDDPDLKLARQVSERYEDSNFLFVTYAPKGEILSDENLATLKSLQEDIEKLKFVQSTFSILNVPLLQSPVKPLSELLDDVPSLSTHAIDKELAKQEFLNSPIYKDLLSNKDFTATVIQVNLEVDETYNQFIKDKRVFREKEKSGTLSAEEKKEYDLLLQAFKQYRDEARVRDHQYIENIRTVLSKYKNDSDIFLGGIAMITNDMVTFLRNDLRFFGIGVLIFLIVVLKLIFKQIRWVVLPLVCCAFSVLATSGVLGFFGWEITVISSNFISIQIIITMAVSVHLTVRYRELVQSKRVSNQRELVLETVNSMFNPCLFATLTTIAGFASLMLGDILPVVHFGLMMSIGVLISLTVAFLVFPIMMIFLKKTPPIQEKKSSRFSLTKIFASMTENHGKLIIVFSLILSLFVFLGIRKLIVENSFISYFKEDTEIYQGMAFLDQQLGGTTPLDIILNFNDAGEVVEVAVTDETETEGGATDEEDDFGDFEDEYAEEDQSAAYWFTPEKMEVIENVHDYLESQPQIGKVLSLGTMLKVGRIINDGKALDGLSLALIYQELPERFRKIILSPYVSIENNEVRFNTRIIDSNPDLRRNELIQKINRELKEELGLSKDNYNLTGIMILYNNMLQSLFDSQILTIGIVLLVLMVMFLILFRSFVISLIAIVPNILSVGIVLGYMGWAGIPLDLMTITIASISVGIAVDDTIHYIHRFKKEFQIDKNYIKAMHRAHQSIGYAMYYTSIIIIIGFSILVTSNFIPTIYFGILTGLAMFIALVASLTLLPQLIIILKPFGKGR